MVIPLLALLAALAAPAAANARTADRVVAIHRKIADPNGGLVVVAHRGCHAAAPAHKLASAPENSLAALDNCVALGVDVMETDVRRGVDGSLVMIHDATLDRTTDGTGLVATMALAQLRKVRLRADLGGTAAPVTDAHIVTLDEMLAHAKGRIVLNLDIKDAIHAEVIDAVIRAGAQDGVIVKTTAGDQSKPLTPMQPFNLVPFMPILRFSGDERQLLDVARIQLSGSRKPIGFELPRLSPAIMPALAEMARKNRIRLWLNTLDNGYIAELGGDNQALADPARVWGSIRRLGVSMIQTDNPEALIAYEAGTASRVPAAAAR
ncbi:glycerophosphodiester phosphodiesterase family protein [Sphingomonas arantia]|uniref:Glycerophosphodiester phosphodiesterase family protein n=1 Tax=Sphingomonas arantia TaxID=1460676 RepID=A0ABW4TXT4_9SPHN